IAALKGDQSVPEAEKREGLAQLEAALKDAKPVQFKQNIALVLKYFDKLAPIMQEQDLKLRPADYKIQTGNRRTRDPRGRDGTVREEVAAGVKGVDRPAGGSIQNESYRWGIRRLVSPHIAMGTLLPAIAHMVHW